MTQTDQTPDLQTVISLIRGNADLRVWSVIVTIMGDLVRAPGDSLAGSTLNVLMGPLDVRADTMRVALHRLRKDGWITSTRDGRRSFYALSDHGRAQTIEAAAQVYASAPVHPKSWYLVISLLSQNRERCESRLAARGFCRLCAGVYLGTNQPQAEPGMLLFSDQSPDLPDSLYTQLLSQTLRDDIQHLSWALDQIDRAGLRQLAPLERAAVRIVILHSWRRIALRLPELPVEAFWPGFTLRRNVHDFLTTLGPINPASLPRPT